MRLRRKEQCEYKEERLQTLTKCWIVVLKANFHFQLRKIAPSSKTREQTTSSVLPQRDQNSLPNKQELQLQSGGHARNLKSSYNHSESSAFSNATTLPQVSQFMIYLMRHLFCGFNIVTQCAKLNLSNFSSVLIAKLTKSMMSMLEHCVGPKIDFLCMVMHFRCIDAYGRLSNFQDLVLP